MPVVTELTSAPAGQLSQLALVDLETREDGSLAVRDSLKLSPSAGAIWYTNLDLGFPEIRASAVNYTDSDGTYDQTHYTGSRAISLNLIVLDKAFGHLPTEHNWDPSIEWNSATYWVSRLSAWLSPRKRPALFFRLRGESSSARWTDLRVAGASTPIILEQRGHREVQLQWVSPTGKMYSFDETTDQSLARDGRTYTRIAVVPPEDQVGRSFPEAYPKEYPVSMAQGASSVRYTGTVPNGLVLRIHAGTSPMENPRVIFTAPDGSTSEVGFNYTLAAGGHIEVDTSNRTAVQVVGGSRTSVSPYMSAPLVWPLLFGDVDTNGNRGVNKVRVSATSSGSDAYVEVLHYNAHLL